MLMVVRAGLRLEPARGVQARSAGRGAGTKSLDMGRGMFQELE